MVSVETVLQLVGIYWDSLKLKTIFLLRISLPFTFIHFYKKALKPILTYLLIQEFFYQFPFF